MEHNSSDILFDNQKIVDIEMDKEVKKSFIEYSMSVITSRPLPPTTPLSPMSPPTASVVS